MAIITQQPFQPSDSAASVWAPTAPMRIMQASVCNPTASGVWLSVYVVRSGDTAAADTKVYHEKAIAADEPGAILSLLSNIGLGSGDALHMEAQTASALTVTLTVQDV